MAGAVDTGQSLLCLTGCLGFVALYYSGFWDGFLGDYNGLGKGTDGEGGSGNDGRFHTRLMLLIFVPIVPPQPSHAPGQTGFIAPFGGQVHVVVGTVEHV